MGKVAIREPEEPSPERAAPRQARVRAGKAAGVWVGQAKEERTAAGREAAEQDKLGVQLEVNRASAASLPVALAGRPLFRRSRWMSCGPGTSAT